MRVTFVVALMGCLLPHGSRADPAELCAKFGNDDTIHPYDRRLRPEFVRAYKLRFPKSHGIPSDPMLVADASFRCMDHQLVACFRGGALPCAKIASDPPHLETAIELDARGFAKVAWTPLD